MRVKLTLLKKCGKKQEHWFTRSRGKRGRGRLLDVVRDVDGKVVGFVERKSA